MRFARLATIKRMRDEARAWGRSGGAADAAVPRDDAAWHASLRREPGRSIARVAMLGARAAEAIRPVPDVFLRLRLPSRLAAELLATIDAAHRRLATLADSVPWDEPWPDPDPPASLRVAREYSIRCRRAPAWVGLLALLEEVVAIWDARDAGGSGRASHDGSVYIRDGWRCTAPGCTSRRNLEDHHVVYRARGGGDDLSNRICLCRFHHQRGEHGGLALCRGVAPLGLVWRLGRDGRGGRFQNEKKLDYGFSSDSGVNR